MQPPQTSVTVLIASAESNWLPFAWPIDQLRIPAVGPPPSTWDEEDNEQCHGYCLTAAPSLKVLDYWSTKYDELIAELIQQHGVEDRHKTNDNQEAIADEEDDSQGLLNTNVDAESAMDGELQRRKFAERQATEAREKAAKE